MSPKLGLAVCSAILVVFALVLAWGTPAQAQVNPCAAKTLNPCAAKTLNPCAAKVLHADCAKTLKADLAKTISASGAQSPTCK